VSISDQDIIKAITKLNFAKKNWQLLDDGEVFKTQSSLLQPVIYKGVKAMLKIPVSVEEGRGSALMICWDGNGSAKVLEHDENALLIERAVGTRLLKQMVINGNEDEANRIICNVVARLHSAKCRHIPELAPLPEWFKALKRAADQHGGIFVSCNETANQLLNAPVEIVALHGDIHYENILDSGTRGWIAIDPKGLIGEKGFDFANIFCNPNIEIAASTSRLSRQVKLIAKEAALDPKRLLNWIIAWAGLSAAWILNDGGDATLPLTVAQIAINELNNF
jgi:streptomycin 6-kinase